MSTVNNSRYSKRTCMPVSRKSEVHSLADSLCSGRVVALGHWESFPAKSNTWQRVPLHMKLEEWASLLDIGLRRGGLAIMLVTGTCIQERLHTEVLKVITERLPNSSLIALNLGEFDATQGAYDDLALALAHPLCIVGHLYFRDPVSVEEHARKRKVRELLRHNRKKDAYLEVLARDEVWALRGANCWFNFSQCLRTRALDWKRKMHQVDAYRRHLDMTVRVTTTASLLTTNEKKVMFALVAARDIKAGEFVGFYTGSYNEFKSSKFTIFEVQLDKVWIIPFPDENNISTAERETHALANMNEPTHPDCANCYMVIQDLSHAEVLKVDSIPNHKKIEFFRCMACFADVDIKQDEALTWHYGTSYDPVRDWEGYDVGKPCAGQDGAEFNVAIANLNAMLSVLGQHVPHYVVHPLLKTQRVKSERFGNTLFG